MKIILINEHIRGQVSNEETFWSVLGDALPGAETLALSSFSGEVNDYLQTADPDVVIYNSVLGDLVIPKRAKKIVLLQDNFVSMELLLPRTILQKIKSFVQGNNSFYRKNITLQRQNITQADITVCVSEHIARAYNISAMVIPIGVDSDLFCPMDKEMVREKHHIPQNKLVKIFVGSTHSVKGFDILLKEITKDTDSFYILVLKDDVPVKSMPNTKVYRKVDQEKLKELYNCADIYVGRSRVETLWLAPIEALFCNVAIDVTKTGLFADWEPANKEPRKEAFQKGLDRETMIYKWKKLLEELL